MKKKYFFGWTNIKWLISELGKMYASKNSYLSKKRVESGVAFIIGQAGMIYFLIVNIAKLSASDIVMWSGVEFAMAGYIVNQIQKEKTPTQESSPEDI